MTDPNYAPPDDVPMQRPFGEDGPSVVKPVAIALVVYNALSVLNSLANMVGIRFVAEMMEQQAKQQPEMQQIADIYKAPWMMLLLGVLVLMSVFSLVCSICMMKRKAYAMAVVGAVVTMINPGGCCCLIGLGLGIWAMVVLMKDEAQAEFSRT